MNEKNRNLVLRVVSSLVLLPIALWLLWVGPGATAALVGFAAIVVTAELYRVVGLPVAHPAAIFGLLASASLSWFALDLDVRWPLALAVLVFAPIVALGGLTLLPPRGDLKRAAPLAAFGAFGPAHVGLSLATVVLLRAMPGERGFEWIFVLLTVTWGNDTGAYFAGRFLGKHKLYERVSPKKTWEGFWGGMAAAVLGAAIVSFTLFPELSVLDAAAIGLGASVLGPLGDLAESMLKRAFEVKDSGRFMPGHGGLYDRVDALLFNAPWVYLYARFLEGLL